MKDVHANFEKAVELLLDCFRSGHKLLLCGNGGSFCDCAHIQGLANLVRAFAKTPVARGTRFFDWRGLGKRFAAGLACDRSYGELRGHLRYCE